jgi:HEAT repeat protein
MRAQASEALKKVGAPAVDPLRAQLKVKIPAVRFWVAQTLGAIGPDAAGAADDLLESMQDEDAEVRYKAVYAVGRVGVKTDRATAGLLKALEDRDERVTETALAVLDEMGAPPQAALPTLGKLAGKESPESVRHSAIKLLGKMGEPAVPTLKVLLKETTPNDSADLARAIAQLGLHAKPMLPDLQLIMLSNGWFGVELELVGTFKKCGADGADGLASVLKKVSDPKTPQYDPGRGAILLKGLGEMGAEAKSAVPTLIGLLKERQLRPEVLETLGDIGPAASAAIPDVERLLDEPGINMPARIALRRMGKIDKK